MKIRNFLFLPALVFLLVAATFIYSIFFRREFYFEKNHLYCLTGASSESPAVWGSGDFAIANVFIAWRDGFPYRFAGALKPETLLMITWEPYLDDFGEDSIIADIAAGDYDALIRAMAQSVTRYGRPCLIRWGHEMNGDWYPWSGAVNGRSPEAYKKSFIRIKNIFESAGCRNALFIFSVNSEDVPREEWNRFENYYPGREYVDFLGIDVYNWGNVVQPKGRKGKWRTPSQIIGPAYKRAIRMEATKPVIITEVASSSVGGDKSLWLEEFLRVIRKKYRAVKGFVWFDIDKETDWAITGRPELMDIYRARTADGFFLKNAGQAELFYGGKDTGQNRQSNNY